MELPDTPPVLSGPQLVGGLFLDLAAEYSKTAATTKKEGRFPRVERARPFRVAGRVTISRLLKLAAIGHLPSTVFV